MLNRRDFLRNSLLAGAGTIALGSIPIAALAARDERVRLTILHTNDMHSHIDPFPADDPKYPGLGGMGKRATLIKQIRATEQHVLLLDAGDVFQGTPYFNFFGGEVEFKLMSQMGYDACAIGNRYNTFGKLFSVIIILLERPGSVFHIHHERVQSGS